MPTFETVKKSCTSCHEIKPLTDFYLDKSKTDGRQSRCKVCFKGSKPTPAGHIPDWRDLIGQVTPSGDSPEASLSRARAMARLLGVPMHSDWAKCKPRFQDFLATLNDEDYREVKVRLGFDPENIAAPRKVPYNG